MTTLGTKAVGSLVYLEENGKDVAYRVVQQGVPSALYDESCDGVFLLREELFMDVINQHSDSGPDYGNSQVHTYINTTFLSRYDNDIQDLILTVRIPYRPGSTGIAINSGAQGLSCKLFFPSTHELGASFDGSGNAFTIKDGSVFDYFESGNTVKSNTRTRTHFATLLGGEASSAMICATTSGYGMYTVSTYYLSVCLVLPYSAPVTSAGKITSNSAPDPTPLLTVPSEIKGGKEVTISWGAATDADGDLKGYILERSIDGGSWVQIYKGSGLSTTNMVEFGTKTVQYRVQAYDSLGATSSYKTSAIVSVTNNTPPQISDTDRDLGEFSASFSLNYTVTDAEDGVVTVAESVNDTEIKAYEVVSGAENTVNFAYNDWAKIPNGLHGFTITATDSMGAEAQRNYSFSKAETQIHLEYAEALESENPAVVGILTVEKEMAEGALFSVEVCNNGFDDVPTWEIVTSAVVNGGRFYLNNATKTAEKWGYNVRIKMDRNGATGDCWIGKVSGFFR